jgi:hypothetical protein
MMMSAAGHAIASYVQFRALAELLIEKGVVTREELEGKFEFMREGALEQTIDEWFDPDVAYHVKMAVRASTAGDATQPATAGDATQPATAGDATQPADEQ